MAKGKKKTTTVGDIKKNIENAAKKLNDIMSEGLEKLNKTRNTGKVGKGTNAGTKPKTPNKPKGKDYSTLKINAGVGGKKSQHNKRKYAYNKIGTHVLYITDDEQVAFFNLDANDKVNEEDYATLRLGMPTVVESVFPNFEEPMLFTYYSDNVFKHYNYSTADRKFGDKKDNVDLDHVVERMNRSIHLRYVSNVEHYFRRSARWYNRFKIPIVDSVLQRGFAHVFFVRPSCNIFESDGKSLTSALSSLDLFTYIYNASPWVLKELTDKGGQDNDFMLSLSNAVQGFSLQDEVLESDSYGKTYTGYKIAFGRHNLESRTAGNLTLSFRDDRNLHIYQIFKAWTEYIAGVYRGYINPTVDDIMNKVLDYVGAIYYVVTAEDGETVLFWSKYYGVFPTSAPSTGLAWGAGNHVSPKDLDVTFAYSYKEDFNPFQILEFNYNSRSDDQPRKGWAPIYDKKAGQLAATWVGPPFITSDVYAASNKADHDRPFCFKLRFRLNDDTEDTAFLEANRNRKIKRGTDVDIHDKKTKAAINKDIKNAKYRKYEVPKPILPEKKQVIPLDPPKTYGPDNMNKYANYKYDGKSYVIDNKKTSGTVTYINEGQIPSKDKRTDKDVAEAFRPIIVSAIRSENVLELSKYMNQLRTMFKSYEVDRVLVTHYKIKYDFEGLSRIINNMRDRIYDKRFKGNIQRAARDKFTNAYDIKDLDYLAYHFTAEPEVYHKPSVGGGGKYRPVDMKT